MKKEFTKRAILAITFAMVGAVTLHSCNDDDTSPKPADVENPLTEDVYYISGIVQALGSPISGATVTCDDLSTTTASDGSYELAITTTSSDTITFTMADYVPISTMSYFPSGSSAAAIYTRSQQITLKEEMQRIFANEDLTLTFAIPGNDDDSITVEIPQTALRENVYIDVTEFIPAASTSTSEAIYSALDSDDSSSFSVTSPFQTLYMTPLDQNFADDITISMPATSSNYFMDVKHVMLVDNDWEVVGDATYNSSDTRYEISLDTLSTHGIAIECDITVTKNECDTLATLTIDNIGNLTSVSQTLSFTQKAGWEVTDSSEVSDSDLYVYMLKYVASILGSTEGVYSIDAARDVVVSGDQEMVIAVEQEYISYTFTFDTYNGSETIYVDGYGSVATSVVVTEGNLW